MKERIKEFVQKTLGCKCPEEVFNIIDYKRDIALTGNITLVFKINIDNRLLVYILDADNGNAAEVNMKEIVEHGRIERDGRGFNRFRLVLGGNSIDDVRRLLIKSFNDSKKNDDKMHIHLVEKDALTQLDKL